MGKKSNKKKKGLRLAFLWQSRKICFVIATLVLIFITAVGSIQTANQIAVVSDHQMLSKSKCTIMKSVAHLQAAVAKENTLLQQLTGSLTLSNDNRQLVQKFIENNLNSSTQEAQENILHTGTLISDYSQTTSDQYSILSGMLSIESLHQNIITNINTFRTMMHQQRSEEAKMMRLAAFESSNKLLKRIETYQLQIVNTQQISSGHAEEAASTLSWFSTLGWVCTALITFTLMIGSHVKQLRLEFAEQRTKSNKKKSKSSQVDTQKEKPTEVPFKNNLRVMSDHKINDLYDLSECHIILAEDGQHNQRLLKTVLEKKGATLHCFENGKEAVDCWKAEEGQKHNIILLDINMPVMDGFEAAALLRSEGCTLPILAVTAMDNDDARQKCYDVGFDGFVSKPVDKTELVATVGALFDQQRTSTKPQ